jgi:hypothetical protein
MVYIRRGKNRVPLAASPYRGNLVARRSNVVGNSCSGIPLDHVASGLPALGGPNAGSKLGATPARRAT